MKLEQKIKKHYTNIGKTPGVLIEDNKRRKILKELGVELELAKPLKNSEIEEEKVEADQIEVSGSMAEETIKALKEEQSNPLSMIPDKYKVKTNESSKSTALSLVNALSNN